MKYNKPLPKPNADTRQFWAGCKKHQLEFQKCSKCGHIRWPPSPVCPQCLSAGHTWTEVSGRGKVYSFIVYRQAYHRAFFNKVPYTVAIVQLDEGPRLLSNIAGCAPEKVYIDMPVIVTWENVSPRYSIPMFMPLENPAEANK